jgi:hypothetical protein
MNHPLTLVVGSYCGVFWENCSSTTGNGLRASDYHGSAISAVLFAESLASGRETF